MGVRRAVDIAFDKSSQKETSTFTYGPLIHNPHVLDLLQQKGVTILDSVPDSGTGTVIIRAHGVPPETKQTLEASGFDVVDATCPKVIRVQVIIKKHAEKGYAVIIAGEKNHPEVIGLYGHTGEKGFIINSLDEFEDLPEFDKAIIVAQTTQNTTFFRDLTDHSEKKYPHYKIYNTICDSTERRQKEIKEISESVDAVVVVGGKESGNTRRLAEIARQGGRKTIHIEDNTDLDVAALRECETVAITAGASTPNWIISQVYEKLDQTGVKKKKWLSLAGNLQNLLLLTNIYLALGAGLMSYASAFIQGIDYRISYALIAFFYILSMQIFNNLTSVKSDIFNNPERSRFYQKHIYPLAIVAVVSGAAVIFTSYTLGKLPFFLLCFMSILGLSYDIKIFPGKKYRKIRDIPSSKTVLITMAWGIVVTMIPALSSGNNISMATPVTFLFISSVAFMRSAFFDVLHMQGDRMVGKETIPMLIGEKKSVRFLMVMNLFLFLLITTASLTGSIPDTAIFYGIIPLIFLGIIWASEKDVLANGTQLSFIVESIFVIIGIMTLLIN